MSNHRIKFITSGNGTLQLFGLIQNNAFGSYQRNLVGYTNNQLFLIERFGDKVIRSHLETFYNVRRAV